MNLASPTITKLLGRRAAVVSIALILIAGLAGGNRAIAGCHGDTGPKVLQSGLHLIAAGASASQVPVADECWWYAGPVQVLYEHGELRYFPLLRSMRCHGPGCDRGPSDSDLQPPAVVTPRSTCDVAIPASRPHHSPRCTQGDPAMDALLPPIPFLAGLFRPPR